MFDALLEAALMIEQSAHHVVPRFEPMQMPSKAMGHPPPPAWLESSYDSVVPRAASPGLSGRPRCSETHNEVEKRRRAFLTQCYVDLQQAVPTVADSKASNVTVLRAAAQFIKTLREDERRLVMLKNRELQRRTALLHRLATLQDSSPIQYVKAERTPSMATHAPARPMFVPIRSTMASSAVMTDAAVEACVTDDSASASASDMGNETETDCDDDEEGIVPDPMSRGASPRPAEVEGLTELNNAMEIGTPEKHMVGFVRSAIHRRMSGDFAGKSSLNHRRPARLSPKKITV